MMTLKYIIHKSSVVIAVAGYCAAITSCIGGNTADSAAATADSIAIDTSITDNDNNISKDSHGPDTIVIGDSARCPVDVSEKISSSNKAFCNKKSVATYRYKWQAKGFEDVVEETGKYILHIPSGPQSRKALACILGADIPENKYPYHLVFGRQPETIKEYLDQKLTAWLINNYINEDMLARVAGADPVNEITETLEVWPELLTDRYVTWGEKSDNDNKPGESSYDHRYMTYDLSTGQALTSADIVKEECVDEFLTVVRSILSDGLMIDQIKEDSAWSFFTYPILNNGKPYRSDKLPLVALGKNGVIVMLNASDCDADGHVPVTVPYSRVSQLLKLKP